MMKSFSLLSALLIVLSSFRDIIFEFNCKKIKEQAEIERALAILSPTDSAQISVQRGAKILKKTLKLEEFPPQLNRVRDGVI